VPTAVDRWIAVGLSGPTTHIREAHQAGSTLEDILDDKVECQLHVVATEGAIEGPFQDPPTYTLYLRVVLPPAPSQFIYYTRESPEMVLDQYMGDHGDVSNPDWLQTVNEPISVFHPRKVMLDIVLFLAGQGINQHVYHRVLHWCSTCQSVYLPRFPLQFGNTPDGFNEANPRSHKHHHMTQ